MTELATIPEAIADIKAGKFLIVVDDEDRENEGDLTIAAECITPEAVNFMARFGRGLICVPLDSSYFERLGIPLMVPNEHNHTKFGTSFGLSASARVGTTTGISAFDRAHSIQVLANPASSHSDIIMPGHVFPLRARDNGVLARSGHTEAAVDFARLAGHQPAGVICEILSEDGSMARLSELLEFGKAHDIKVVSIEALTAYRRQHEAIVKRIETTSMPMARATFEVHAYRDHQGLEHLALVLPPLQDNPLVRLHSACLTGDVFGSLRCDCGEQLKLAMQRICAHGNGLILYLAQEGRGIGLANKIKAYALQDRGMDTVEANRHLGFPDDARAYDIGGAILKDLGLDRVQLMTNNPDKVDQLEACGVKVSQRLPHQPTVQNHNREYLETKAKKMGHILPTSN